MKTPSTLSYHSYTRWQKIKRAVGTVTAALAILFTLIVLILLVFAVEKRDYPYLAEVKERMNNMSDSRPGRNIKVGDYVSVHFDNGLIFVGIVENVPSDTGDLWYIRLKQATMAINPNAAKFMYIVKDDRQNMGHLEDGANTEGGTHE